MAGTAWARLERAAICDRFVLEGPDAPTLCQGWTTRDLAVHLVVREGNPLATMRHHPRDLPWPELVAAVRSGPPRLSIYGIPGADALLNTAELYVHHEDVRRAQPDWQPRELETGFSDVLWRTVAGRFSGVITRRLPLPVLLRRLDGPTVERTTGRGAPQATIAGSAQEILLYLFGRKEHALVTIQGDPPALARLRGADLSL